jgi:selenocysteine lyase/cysteine desulfurase
VRPGPSGRRGREAVLEAVITPKTKVILVCHITNLTGQIFPVKEICRMGRERGIEVIVDGAHAYGHFPFTHADLDCDYYGTSLHKWLFAPHGTGFLFVKKSRIGKLWPLMAAPPEMAGDVGVDTAKLAAHLWEKRRIIVVPILHEEFQGLRVTPSVYTTLGEVDAFADEMERVIEKGLPT